MSLGSHQLYFTDFIVSFFSIKKFILAWRLGLGATLFTYHHPLCNSTDSGIAGFRSLEKE
jgi:hypothetical protein